MWQTLCRKSFLRNLSYSAGLERVSSRADGVCEVTNKQLQGDDTGDGLSFDAADEQLLSTLLKLVALTVDSQR